MTDPNLDSPLSDTTQRSRNQSASNGRSTRSDIRERMTDLDAQILVLEQALDAVRLERQDLQTRLDAYKYPILTLPTEITPEIFVHFLPPYPERPPATGLTSPEFLAQICRAWREIALSTPRLWRAIKLSPPTTSPTMALDLLRTWVLRSKDCPLSICLQSSTWLLNVDFIQALIPHSERWEYIDFNLPIGSLRLIGADFPLLRSLTLGPTHYAKETDSLDAISLFSNAPLLTQVALYNTFGPSEIQLPWSQFTSISANFLTSTGYCSIPLPFDSFAVTVLWKHSPLPLSNTLRAWMTPFPTSMHLLVRRVLLGYAYAYCPVCASLGPARPCTVSAPCRYGVSASRVSCWYAVSVPASPHSAYTSLRTPPPPPRARRTTRAAAWAGSSVGVGVGVAVADGGLTGDPDAVDADSGGDVHALSNNPADSAALSMRPTDVGGAVELVLEAKVGETVGPPVSSSAALRFPVACTRARAHGGAAATSRPRLAFAVNVGVTLLPLSFSPLLPPPSSASASASAPASSSLSSSDGAASARLLCFPVHTPYHDPPAALLSRAISPSNSAPRPPAEPDARGEHLFRLAAVAWDAVDADFRLGGLLRGAG
ncbi:hypothetical protein C8J57DRAFT_1711678 [Mycena rebaudengoi]|nr:hypothetical protein C8J57DRAFT_1711678 [Mycena rebaudengoi]